MNEHNLERNTTACKYLNYSGHGNLDLGKLSPQIVDMCGAIIWIIFSLFDSRCTIGGKVRIKFLTFIS